MIREKKNFFFSRTHFLSFSFIVIVYRVLKAFSLNATLIFTFNNNNNRDGILMGELTANRHTYTYTPTWYLLVT